MNGDELDLVKKFRNMDRIQNLEVKIEGVQTTLDELRDCMLGDYQGKPGLMHQLRESELRFNGLQSSVNEIKIDQAAIKKEVREMETESWRTKLKLAVVVALVGGGVGSAGTKIIDYLLK